MLDTVVEGSAKDTGCAEGDEDTICLEAGEAEVRAREGMNSVEKLLRL